MSLLPLRSEQQAILRYPGKRLAVLAVPGSGKTFTLARLTAEVLQRNQLADDQEVLIVTLVNAAVDNFDQRVRTFLEAAPGAGRHGLLPRMDYRVRTLHGLAHDLIRERPDLAGLDSRFQILDDREAANILRDICLAWLRNHPGFFQEYLSEDIDASRRDWAEREQLPELLQNLAGSAIRLAKDSFNFQTNQNEKDKQYNPQGPDELLTRLEAWQGSLPLAQACVEIYANYQDALAYRGAVDFDDLVRLALRVLKSDPEYTRRLRQRWPYILEDEAQDSSSLQQDILEELAGDSSVWVRVGDPNQAIYETFTTADPRHLRDFGTRYKSLPLSVSSRSTASIIKLANHLANWTQKRHPVESVRDALAIDPPIKPASENDPFPNPPDYPKGIHLITRKYSPDEEIQVVARSLERWLPEHPDQTVAVLAARNERAFKLVDELRRRNIEYEDSLLRSSSTTRFSAGALANLLRYLSDPQSPARLATAYRVWQREAREDDERRPQVERLAGLLEKCRRVEDYLWPGPEVDWLESSGLNESAPAAYAELLDFRQLVRRWQAAVSLPVDQALLALAQDLLHQPAELALAHKLAALMRRAAMDHPEWRLPELSEELAVIARNERRFLGFSAEDSGFDPERYKGRVVVATMHKAKGLEWDRVYLMSINNYDFPAGLAHDSYIAEKWFLRDHLNLEAEALRQLQFLAESHSDPYQDLPAEGEASAEARLAYIRERLRLLYVGITRARRDLIVTWNTGRGQAQPAAALVELQEWWAEQNAGRSTDGGNDGD